MEDKLNDMGVNALLGAEVMTKIGIHPTHLKDGYTFNKVKDIMEYMNTVPPQDRSYFLNRITAGKNVDKLDHVWGYVELNKKRNEAQKGLNKLNEEIEFYER